MSETNFAKNIRWDLTDLYVSSSDPKLTADLKTAESKALDFEKKYKPLLEKAGQNGRFPIGELLKDYKELVTLMTKLGVFAHLSFAEKTSDPSRGAFMQKIQVSLTDIQSHTIFFEVLWNKLDKKTVDAILSDPAAAPDKHFLEHLRIYAPHTLVEGEEKIMAVKSNTGGSAFSRLFDETMNNIPFFIEENGKKVKKNESEVLALLHSTERPLRKMASESLAEGLQNNTRLLTYIYNMILADHRSSLKIRNYEHPMDPMNLSNEIDRESVMRLVESVKNAYPLAARYYRLKKKLLGLDTLYDYDRYAHLDTDGQAIPFEECKKIILEGYNAFSPEAGRIVQQFFDKRWIDAEVRDGKQGGGFCCSTTPDLHPYILVNYTGTTRDVMTVAHELGHGLHQYLAAQRVGVLEQSAPLTMAETASVFGEMIIFDLILEREKDPKKRLALLCGKIDDNFATVFRQIVMTDFELQAHEAGLKNGELAEEALNEFWIGSNAKMYGDGVTLTEHYRHGWKYIPHFVHSPFYCYAYAFAQLFVLSLYQKYKEGKQSFIPVYLDMLSLGGSRKPEEIARMAGFDLNDPHFWKSGLSLLEKLVEDAERLA
jgi:oligoendopeptidase F